MTTGRFTRRSLLGAAATAAAAAGLAGCGGTGSGSSSRASVASSAVEPVDCAAAGSGAALWKAAMRRGLVYGSSTATWQISDAQYRALFAREAAILFTEDDLLWYRLRPKPTSDLDFSYCDRIIGFAEKQGMLVFGAHLVWDEGFGDGWSEADLFGMDSAKARKLLLGTVKSVVGRYRGRVTAWSVANEVIDSGGMRQDVPWYMTVGPTYVEDAFHTAHEADPAATLVINDFGFEVDDDFAAASDKRATMLDLLDQMLAKDVPVHALGVQAHLSAATFDSFDASAYKDFLARVADRGLAIIVTELDVLDDGLPVDAKARDQAVADVYQRYLEAALDQQAVGSVMTFGLSDRYTWLQEDYPRPDKAPRRPLPYDDALKPKPAHAVLERSLMDAPQRTAAWTPPRC
jgi:endo-1,4-beta-xylanase